IQFRHLLRILVFGSFALICLAGIGLDTLWKTFQEQLTGEGEKYPKVIRVSMGAGLVIIGLFMAYGVGDLYLTHRPIVQSREIYQPAYEVMSWIRQNDLGDFYVRHNATNAWQEATISNDLRYLEVWYHFADIRALEGKINQRLVQAKPKYLTQSPTEPAPAAGKLLAVVDDYNIYELTKSLPMVFVVDHATLQSGGEAGPLAADDVTQEASFFSSPNKLETIAEGAPNQTLVVLMTKYPSWQARVDGQERELENVGGYMAVEVQPGVHKYAFTYVPSPFYIGLSLSSIATLFALWLFVSDLELSRRAIRDSWQELIRGIRWAGRRWAGWLGRLKPKWLENDARQAGLISTQLAEGGEELTISATSLPQVIPQPRRSTWHRWAWPARSLASFIRRAISLEMALFLFAIGLYLSTRLIGLQDFPIYFFTDEAVQTVMAEDFVHNNLRNYGGELLPTYFNKDPTYNLSSVSVYLQVIPYLLFGKSVFVTRAVSVLISTLGALAVGLILRDIFKQRYWWCGVLLLSIAPAWFLHSRTAFETVEMASFYAGFLYFYLRYRYISPKALFPALVMGALVFYTYSPGQLVIVVTGILLLLSDIRYHWKNRKTALWGLLLLAVLVVPYLRYSITHPGALMQHLSTRAPYWAQNIGLWDKLSKYFANYVSGLNPMYWFLPNQTDLQRHLMKGYGHLFIATLPLFTLGLIIVITRLRSPAHRAVFLAALAAPSGSALVGVGITRLLVFVIPAVLMIALGLELLLSWIEKLVKWIGMRRGRIIDGRKLSPVASVVLGLVLSLANIYMLRDALVNGPTWYQDYTLAGMQYGARQLFGAINDYLGQHPDAQLVVSPSWTNGADAVAEFFLSDGSHVRLGSVEGHLYQHLPLDDNLVFVMLPVEMDKVVSSGKFKNMRVDEVLPYPNGAPGFYFVHLQYVDNIDQILAAEQEERNALQESNLMIGGELVQVGYSMLDMGSIELLFDGDPNTVARTLEANPFVIELTFPDERLISGYRIIVGSANVRVTTLLYPGISEQPVGSSVEFDGSVGNPELMVSFDHPVTAGRVRFEIYQPYSGVPANVHVWELELK
ncbi:MAG TPA: glycosyltransferase family 39 protein, partial [Anaerolineales bacterium]